VSFASVWRRLIRHLRWQSSRSRSRHALAELTEHQLRDIGLSVDEAQREARRSLMVRLDGPLPPPL
jgi:uncharacterized protein YjiS (DUF1127 family)